MAFQQTQVYSTKRINLHHKYYVGKKCDVGFSYTTKPCKTRVYHPDVGYVCNISQKLVLYAIFRIFKFITDLPWPVYTAVANTVHPVQYTLHRKRTWEW